MTWIRTKTNCTKNSCATVTPSGNPIPFFEWSAKIGVGVKFSKYLWVLGSLLSNFLNLTIQIHNQVLKSTLWAVNYYY